MLNLNPELVDQDKIRKTKRKHMLKYAAIPCLLLLACSAFILRVGVFNVVYSVSYGNQNYEISDSMADMQGIGNFIMPYVKYYDSGVAKIRRGIYKGAEDEFRASLRENPPEELLCHIYTNLSLSIELQADDKFKNGNYDEALVLYTKAQSTLYAHGCASKNDDEGSDQLAKNAKQRIDGKMSKTMNRINSVSDDQDGPHETPTDKTLTQEQQAELERRRAERNEVSWKVQNGLRGSSGSYCGYGDICW